MAARTNNLDTTGLKVLVLARDLSELGGADGSEIVGVGKEDTPRVTEPLVELDRSLGGLGGEVRSGGSEAEVRHFVREMEVWVWPDEGGRDGCSA